MSLQDELYKYLLRDLNTLYFHLYFVILGELQLQDSGAVISIKKGFLLLLIICLFCLISANSGQIFNFILLAIFLIVFSRIAVP